MLLIVAVPFGSLRQVSLGVMNVGLTEIVLLLTIVSWLLWLAADREAVVNLPALTLPLVLFAGVLGFSLLVADSLAYGLKETIKWLEVLVIYVLVANVMDRHWTRVLLCVILGVGAAAALHGIYQFLFQVGPEGFVLFERYMRAYGAFEQPNPYAGYIGLTLPVAVGIVLAGTLRTAGEVKAQLVAWAVVCGAVMLAALVMSWSRGAWLGFAGAVAAIMLAIAARSARSALILGLLALLLIGLLLLGGIASVPQAIVQRVSDFVPYLGVVDVRGAEVTDANYAVLERMAHWQTAVAMWTDSPWLGVGIGNYEPAYARYALPQWPLALGHAHNYYLNIGAEAGIVGLLTYLSLWIAALIVAWRETQMARGWVLGLALGVLGILVHLSSHNLFDNLFVHGIYLHVAILLGALAANGRKQHVARRAS
jgi:O-antigen ligase